MFKIQHLVSRATTPEKKKQIKKMAPRFDFNDSKLLKKVWLIQKTNESLNSALLANQWKVNKQRNNKDSPMKVEEITEVSPPMSALSPSRRRNQAFAFNSQDSPVHQQQNNLTKRSSMSTEK